MTQIETPPVSSRTTWADIVERTAWTLLQGATATGLVAWYQTENPFGLPDLPKWALIPVTGLIAAALSALKSALAAKFGNGSAATLPDSVEPVPAGKVIAQETDSGLAVAGQAPLQGANGDVPRGTPVEVAPAEPDEDPAGELPDEGGDLDAEAPIPPEGFEDGTGHRLMPDGTVIGPDGKPVDTSKLD